MPFCYAQDCFIAVLSQDKLATTDSGLVINYFAVSFDERFVRW